MIRSLMFVPAKEKMLKKIVEFTADAYIIDLEDSIPANAKSDALKAVVEFLENYDYKKSIYVRVNGRGEGELHELDKFVDIGFMLPKFEGPIGYDNSLNVLKKHKVIALIETPLGILKAAETAECSWVDSLAFGAEDYTATVNMKNENALLIMQKSHLVNCARCYNKTVYDTPSFNIDDVVKFGEDVEYSVNLGFDGKLLINPRHIQPINDAFKSIDIQSFKYIINQYEQANQAVVVIDGKVYEKMHIDRMRKILKENGGK